MMNFLGRKTKKEKKEGAIRFDSVHHTDQQGDLRESLKKKKKGKKGKKKVKKNKRKKERSQQPLDLNFDEVPQGEHIASLDETEAVLLHLHSTLNEFYNVYKPENVDEDVLTILMQFFIDAGADALNQKLKNKYGVDLDTFRQIPPPPGAHMSLPPAPDSGIEDLPPPPPLNMTAPHVPMNENMARTMERAKRKKLEGELGINLPPPPPNNESMIHSGHASEQVAASLPRSHSKKNNMDAELTKYKEKKERESVIVTKPTSNLILDDTPEDGEEESNISDFFEDNDDILKLSCLDKPLSAEDLTARDYIEAFYSKHDNAKLDTEEAILRFVRWVEKYSLEELSTKLEGKYGEGLFDFEKLAVRRKNLEKALTDFYLQHDRHKLDTRWTILKILAWTFQHGVPALNKKFETRYGQTAVRL